MASTQARQEAANAAYREALSKGKAVAYQKKMQDYYMKLHGESAKGLTQAVAQGAGLVGGFIPGLEEIAPAAADVTSKLIGPLAGLNEEQVFDDPYTAQNVASTMRILSALGDIGHKAQAAVDQSTEAPGEDVYETTELPTPAEFFSDTDVFPPST